MSNQSKSLTYFFEGRKVRASDLRTDQETAIERYTEHLILGHGWGIIHGLRVESDEGSYPQSIGDLTTESMVTTGTAIDGYGRVIEFAGSETGTIIPPATNGGKEALCICFDPSGVQPDENAIQDALLVWATGFPTNLEHTDFGIVRVTKIATENAENVDVGKLRCQRPVPVWRHSLRPLKYLEANGERGHGWGIIQGLMVESDHDSSPESVEDLTTKSSVTTGTAIDGYGRFIEFAGNEKGKIIPPPANGGEETLCVCFNPNATKSDDNAVQDALLVWATGFPTDLENTDFGLVRVTKIATENAENVDVDELRCQRPVPVWHRSRTPLQYSGANGERVTSPAGDGMLQLGNDAEREFLRFRIVGPDDQGQLRNDHITINHSLRTSIQHGLEITGDLNIKPSPTESPDSNKPGLLTLRPSHEPQGPSPWSIAVVRDSQFNRPRRTMRFAIDHPGDDAPASSRVLSVGSDSLTFLTVNADNEVIVGPNKYEIPFQLRITRKLTGEGKSEVQIQYDRKKNLEIKIDVYDVVGNRITSKTEDQLRKRDLSLTLALISELKHNNEREIQSQGLKEAPNTRHNILSLALRLVGTLTVSKGKEVGEGPIRPDANDPRFRPWLLNLASSGAIRVNFVPNKPSNPEEAPVFDEDNSKITFSLELQNAGSLDVEGIQVFISIIRPNPEQEKDPPEGCEKKLNSMKSDPTYQQQIARNIRLPRDTRFVLRGSPFEIPGINKQAKPENGWVLAVLAVGVGPVQNAIYSITSRAVVKKPKIETP